jgi:glutamate-1-semialdehyde aminotransferase
MDELQYDLNRPVIRRDRWEWFNRSERCIAHGALTNSKRPSSFIKGVYPTHLVRGHGCEVWDHVGKKYVDFIGANGTNLLGYGNQLLATKLKRRFTDGSLLSLGSILEVETAEKFKAAVPMIQSLRFLKTGSEACIAAITIARAYTGRSVVYSDGYHGWINEFTSLTPPHNGIPNEFGANIRKFNRLEQITEETAAVIIEPVNLDASKERFDFLQALRDRCTATGTVLIFDEVITGFRVPKYTVAHWTGVRPDLICLGKAIGGGLPLAIVGGSKAIMECEKEYFVSSTFAGDTLALTAAKEFVDIMLTKRKIEDLWESGGQFIKKFNEIAPELVRLEGYPTRAVFTGDEKAKALLFQEACLAGILLGPSWFYSFPHMDMEIINVLEDLLWKIKTQKVLLKGEPPRSPFAAQVRQKSS